MHTYRSETKTESLQALGQLLVDIFLSRTVLKHMRNNLLKCDVLKKIPFSVCNVEFYAIFKLEVKRMVKPFILASIIDILNSYIIFT